MRPSVRRIAWVLASFALLFVLISCAFPIFSCCHNCLGDHCPVCLQIRLWHNALRLFGAIWLCMALSPALSAGVSALQYRKALWMHRRTPVTLKIKLLN